MYANDQQLHSIRKTAKEVENITNQWNVVLKWYESNLFQEDNFLVSGDEFRFKTEIQRTASLKMDSAIEQHSKIKATWSDNWWQLILYGHVSNMSKKASGWLGVISRQRNMISTKAKPGIYKWAILPHLTYCRTMWHFCCSFDSSKVERVQQRGSHAVYCNKIVKKVEELLVIYLSWNVDLEDSNRAKSSFIRKFNNWKFILYTLTN